MSAIISKAVNRFAEARSNGRRFHEETLGKDVNPECSFGDFLLLVAANDENRLAKRYESYRSKTALSAEGGGAVGGYLVPPTLRDDLMGDVAEQAIFRPRATVVPVASNTLNLPYWDAVEATGLGVAPYWGGMKMSFTAEGDALTESEPQFRDIELKMHELGGIVQTSGPFMQDAVGLDAWLRRAFARSLAWYEDWYCINGNGVGKPLGLLNAPGAIIQSRGTTGAYSVADGQKMLSDLFSPFDEAVWLFSITASGSVVAQSGWRVNGRMMQYGYPLYRTLLQPPLGTKGDAIVFDPSLYIIGDRQALEIAASPYYSTNFQTNSWTWRVVERIDAQPLLNSPLTVPDGAGSANTVSPYVILNT